MTASAAPSIVPHAQEHAHWLATDSSFPELLRDAPSPPKELFTIGRREILARPCVSIVGTRNPTSYGSRVTRQLAIAFANAGATIVSGMALGVDGIAHRAVLDVGGNTVAVLGPGIDQIYPPQHRDLYHDIAERGLVMSEFGPGKPMFRGCFPRRNRIIAALGRLVVVVQAGSRSGALITATYAADMDRLVAAVPGSIDSPQSSGTNHLIRDGAHVIASIDDAVALLQSTASAMPDAGDWSAHEVDVWNAVPGAQPISLDDLVSATALAPQECMTAVTQLELRGLVHTNANGLVARA